MSLIISTTRRLSNYPCSSVHNIRIERLWVDVTKQLGAKWAEFFKLLEVQYELDPSNSYHIWLIHMLFLDTINDEIDFFIRNWNAHRLQIAHKRSRSPLDLFNFDMLVLGIRGRPMQFVQADLERQHEHDQLVDNLEMYGVDWQDLTNQRVIESHLANNPVGSEPLTSWIRSGPPPKLNTVSVEPPVLDQDPSDFFIENAIPRIQPYMVSPVQNNRKTLWVEALRAMRLGLPFF